MLTIKPTFPDMQMFQSQIFTSTSLVVIETSYLTYKECACDQFHFLIPLHQPMVIKTESKLHPLKERSVFPCNPLQPHRVEDTGITDFKAAILYFENTLIQTAAKELYGHGDLEFRSMPMILNRTLWELVQTFTRECRARQPGYNLMLESLSLQAAILLLRESHHNHSFSSFQPGEYQDKKCIAKAIEYLADNYQSKMSLSDLAKETHYSPYHFLRIFKRHTGRTPFEYLIDMKIEKAKDMLRNTDHTITHICDACGFSCLSYFSQAFKKKTGLTPTQFKNLYHPLSKDSY